MRTKLPRIQVCLDYLDFHDVDISAIHRVNAIMDQRFSAIDMMENVADEDIYCGADLTSVQSPGWVYALFEFHSDCPIDILYVGLTRGRLATRMQQHMRRTDVCWRRADRLGKSPDWVAAWNVGDACTRLEKAAILALQPLLNTKDIT